MIIKKYVVSNMNEAMTRIRYELGKDAVIISQRKIRKPGINGFFSKKVIEVTAAVDKNYKKEDKTNIKQNIKTIKNIVNKNISDSNEKDIQITNGESELQKKIKSILEKRNDEESKNDKEQSKNIEEEDKKDISKDEILKEMKKMKTLINEVFSKNENIEIKSEIEKKLLKFDIEDNILREILDKVKKDDSNDDDMVKVKKILKDMISVSKKSLDKALVLVGPTGVGKTTTIAKLAGEFALMEKKKVGLITVDTYRIGAVEQLKTYADIMNIPFKVIFTSADMKMAIESMKECDIILIDTTGRSSKNVMQISELRTYIDKVNTKNIHLVISSTTKNDDIIAIAKGYKVLGYNNVIITKLDETTTYGSIVNISKFVDKPVSYITTGQKVPDDIKVPTKNELISLIMGEKNIC